MTLKSMMQQSGIITLVLLFAGSLLNMLVFLLEDKWWSGLVSVGALGTMALTVWSDGLDVKSLHD